MAAPTEKTLNYGLRYACVFELDANGYPKASGITAYEGAQFKGATAFDLTLPDARKLTGLGEDGITQVVYLPPQEGADARLNVEAADPVLAALLDGTRVLSVGEASIVGIATDKQGFEPRVALLLYQAAKGLETGKTYWHSFIISSAQIVRKSPGMGADKAVTQYQVAPGRTQKHLWGAQFSNANEGFLEAQILESWSNYPLRIASYLGDGSTTVFNFPINFPAVSTDGIKVWKNGTEVTTGLTKTVTGITFTTAPANNDVIVVLREVAG
jgi:hypothetical protein